MTELLGPGAIQGGAAAIVVIVILLVLKGKLVPRAQVDDLRADRDARIAAITEERDTWRRAFLTSEEARHVAQAQVGELLETSRTMEHLLRSLPRPGQGVGHAPADRGVVS
ncbi:hypothetical protein [Kitasatospora mediocidica]|uniref:hypothetical protein n=1 Tax=Kitasatospora mediocidica TaxID=58352 RepID=UPI00055F5434|nr:hypothetical protein [Kitasatospora mediocidica]